MNKSCLTQFVSYLLGLRNACLCDLCELPAWVEVEQWASRVTNLPVIILRYCVALNSFFSECIKIALFLHVILQLDVFNYICSFYFILIILPRSKLNRRYKCNASCLLTYYDNYASDFPLKTAALRARRKAVSVQRTCDFPVAILCFVGPQSPPGLWTHGDPHRTVDYNVTR